MPSYVVTGASRGLGYEFVRQFSSLPDSVVVGLVRNVEAAKQKADGDGLKNVHFILGDITSQKSLEAAAAQIAEITPSIDYLINNAAFISAQSAFNSLSDFQDDPAVLETELLQAFQTNVIGVVKTINAFMSLIQKSSVKKVIAISTGLADDALSNDFGVFEAAPYSISKAALNTVVAKYNAKHGKKDGILFMSISPGVVDTGNDGLPPPDSDMPAKFAKAYPNFTGPISPAESVQKVRAVIEKASASNEFAGAFVSHLGNKQWL